MILYLLQVTIVNPLSNGQQQHNLFYLLSWIVCYQRGLIDSTVILLFCIIAKTKAIQFYVFFYFCLVAGDLFVMRGSLESY
jgi:hypothetical protein